MLHRAKHLNPDAVVVAVGCYVQTGAGKIEDDSCIDLAIGNNRKKEIVDILNAFLKEREEGKGTGRAGDIIDISKTTEYEEMKLERTAEHSRAYIRCRTDATSSAVTVSFPLHGEGSGAGGKKTCWKRSAVLQKKVTGKWS